MTAGELAKALQEFNPEAKVMVHAPGYGWRVVDEIRAEPVRAYSGRTVHDDPPLDGEWERCAVPEGSEVAVLID